MTAAAAHMALLQVCFVVHGALRGTAVNVQQKTVECMKVSRLVFFFLHGVGQSHNLLVFLV